MLRKSKPSDRTEALRQVPLFERCTDAEIAEIEKLATELAVHAGQVLVQEGHIGREFVVLLDGSATVTTETGNTVTIGPGDFVGELALIDDGRRNATVTMAEDGEVLVMSGAEFRTLLETVPIIAVRLLPVVGARLRPPGTV